MTIQIIGKQAKIASKTITSITTDQKNKVLKRIAEELKKQKHKVFSANLLDITYAKSIAITGAMLERLTITEKTIKDMIDGLLKVVELDDPIGITTHVTKRPNGLDIYKKTVPIGVIAIIYESRPNVTMDAFSLCWKTGNSVILKGGN